MLEELCQAPLCLEFDLDSYDRSWTHVARFRGRSGWLHVARATIQNDEILRTVRLLAACDEWENPYPTWQAEHLLHCQWSELSPCYDEVPSVLDDILCEAEGELYARWQRETNAEVAALNEAGEEKIHQLEFETKQFVDRLALHVADLRRRRRMAGVTDDQRGALDAAISNLETARDQKLEWLDRKRRMLRHDLEFAEERLWTRSEVHIEVEAICSVRWFGRSHYSANPRIRLPLVQEEIYSAAAIQSLQYAAQQAARWQREYERWLEKKRAERNAKDREMRARRRAAASLD